MTRGLTTILTAVLCTQVLFASAVADVPGTPPAAEPAAQSAAAPLTLNDRAGVESFVDGLVRAQMDRAKIPAAVVSIVHGGEVLLAKGYGRDPSRGTPIDASTTLFRIASISKLFTWTAVMQQVEAGKIDLDADVNTYLRAFEIPATYPEPITMRHLMTHTAGFEDGVLGYGEYLYGDTPIESTDPDKVTPDMFVPAEKVLGEIIPTRVRPPGAMMSYSNYGAVLAGFIVEQVSGEKFNDYVRRHIFEPLGMSRTTFEEPLPAELRKHLIAGYTRSDGVHEAHPFLFFGAFAPEGAAATSGSDMTRFMLAHLQGGQYSGQRILEAATAQLMHAPSFRLDERFPAMRLGFFGLQLGAVEVIAHGGDTPGYNSIMALAPAQQLGIFVSYAGDGGAGAAEPLVRAFLDRYFSAAPLVQAVAPQTAETDPERYAGQYLPTRRNQSTIEKLLSLFQQASVSVLPNGNLLVHAGEDEPWQFAAIGNGLFTQVEGNYQLTFRADEQGQVTHMLFDFLPIPPMERAAWYESLTFWRPVLIISLLLFVTTLLGVYYRRRDVKAMAQPQRRAAYFSALVAAWPLIYLIATVVVVAVSGNNFFLRLPFAFKALLVMPLVFVALTAGLIWFAMRCWRGGYWSAGRRVHYTATALAAVLFCFFFYQWNMLGWHY